MATAEGRTVPFTGPEAIDAAVLETFPYDGPVQEIVTTTREFSAVCPFSGLPDLADLTVRYIPGDCCIELKSLKYYIMSYRNVGIFQEHATARVAEDLQRVLGARSLTVTTVYNVRGGFETTCSVTLPATTP
ncbi:MAG TPA: preQ(1) synthase [Gemmatimonadales bacterium]|jgi:7-cyano-7-deazaguanine reductase